jgi:hypothetical protein
MSHCFLKQKEPPATGLADNGMDCCTYSEWANVSAVQFSSPLMESQNSYVQRNMILPFSNHACDL